MKQIRLVLHEIRRAVSFPMVMDVVFYKDEKGALYRLEYIEDRVMRDFLEGWHHLVCLGKYAPKAMEGEVIFEDEEALKIMDDKVVYYVRKNAEKFEFLDADAARPSDSLE